MRIRGHGVPAGTYSLSARVFYNSGSSADSAASLVTVYSPLVGLRPHRHTTGALDGRANIRTRVAPFHRTGSTWSAPATPAHGGWRRDFFYDVANGTVIQPSASSHPDQQYPPNMLTGIGYRTDPVLGKQLDSGRHCPSGYQANWSTTDGGLTWGAMRADTTLHTAGLACRSANSLGAVTGSDKFYTIIGDYPQDINNQRTLYTCKGSNTWSSATPCAFSYNWFYIDNPDAGNMYGVAGATGRAVGYYRDQWADCRQAAQLRGGVSAQGVHRLAGELRRHLGVQRPGRHPRGRVLLGQRRRQQDLRPLADAHRLQLARLQGGGDRGHQFVAGHPELPDFPDTAGSTRLATPYGCSADGRYAVGMNYRGAERAVLWDTGDANPANWTVLDLTERAAAEGILGTSARPLPRL